MNIEYNKTYDYQEVKEEVRRRQIAMLDAVVDICDRHNLTYWLDGGTLLGAIRHGGFIPWDDDIDIGLMRDDYEKLVKILNQELPNDMAAQTIDSDLLYTLPFVKVRDKYSKIEDGYKYNGIFIDIFPFDMIPKNTMLRKLQRFSFMLFEAMFVHKKHSDLNVFKESGLKSLIVQKSIKFISKIGDMLGKGGYKVVYKWIVSLNSISPSGEVGDGLTASWAYYKSIRCTSVYFPTEKATFENKEYAIPGNSDAYLNTLYGKNYMIPIKMNYVHINKIIFLEKV